EAFQQKELNPENTSFLSAQDSWSSIGPNNFAGRTIALALDPTNPNILFAGSASGGLWKLTISGPGENDYIWQRISTGFPVLGVGAVAIDPRDKKVIFIGTGETYGYHWQDGETWGSYWMRIRGNYGIGILKSTDGGATWTKTLDWTNNQQRGVLSLAFDPQNPDTLFAGTTEGVFRTQNAGLSWELVHNAVMAIDIKINPDSPNVIFASCGNMGTPGHGIYRSLDGGTNWTKLSYGLPEFWMGKAKLDIFLSSPTTIYADIANYRDRLGLFRSQDNGNTWELLSTLEEADLSTGQGYYSHFVRANPTDSSQIFVAKVEYAFSTDGGRSFSIPNSDIYDFVRDPTVAHGDCHTFVNHPQDPDTFFMATDGGVHITKDGGRTFRNLNNNYITTQFYPGFSSSPSDPNFAIGGLQDNGTSFYMGRSDWIPWVTFGDGGYSAIDRLNENIVYTSSQFLFVYRTEDRFQTAENWRLATPYRYNSLEGKRHGESEYAAFIAPFVLAGHNIIYSATNYIYRSDDGGENWICLNNDLPLNDLPIVALSVSQTNYNVVYAATAPYIPNNTRPEVFKTRDGGVTWDNITYNLPNRYIVDLVTSPKNGDIVYAALSGFGFSHVFRLSGNSPAWEDIGIGLPDLPTNAVAVDPEDPENIYIGNDLGVWVSTDYGKTWFSFNDGLPEAVLVMDLSIQESSRKIRAVTHGNGVYERSLLPRKVKGVKFIRR
ncbi:hypothetical protein ACFLRX_10090, partial [Acidobacteriota bacterium]